MLRKKNLPRQLSGFSCLAGLSFVLIALLSIACDKISSLLNPHANVVLEGEITVWKGLGNLVQYKGRLKNIGDADAYSTTITFDTYNKDNELISVDSWIPLIGYFEPGEVQSFTVYTPVKWEEYDHYEYKIDWSE